MEYRRLGKTNLDVSILGLGGSSLGGHYENTVDDDMAFDTVEKHFNCGVNFIDTAPYYGKTRAETALGKILRRSSYDRAKYYVATKIGRFDVNHFDFTADGVKRSLNESLARLQLDHVDVIQCHDIEFANLDQIVNETLPALHKIKEQGKAKYIGITGFPLKAFTEVIDRLEKGDTGVEIDTVLSYCHYTIQNDTLTSLIPYLKDRNIGVINAAVLSMGILTKQGPPSWHPASQEIQGACRRAVDHATSENERIEKLAIQYSLANKDIHSTLVGTADITEAKNNFDWTLDYIKNGFPGTNTKLVGEIVDILKPVRNHAWKQGLAENND